MPWPFLSRSKRPCARGMHGYFFLNVAMKITWMCLCSGYPFLSGFKGKPKGSQACWGPNPKARHTTYCLFEDLVYGIVSDVSVFLSAVVSKLILANNLYRNWGVHWERPPRFDSPPSLLHRRDCDTQSSGRAGKLYPRLSHVEWRHALAVEHLPRIRLLEPADVHHSCPWLVRWSPLRHAPDEWSWHARRSHARAEQSSSGCISEVKSAGMEGFFVARISVKHVH